MKNCHHKIINFICGKIERKKKLNKLLVFVRYGLLNNYFEFDFYLISFFNNFIS